MDVHDKMGCTLLGSFDQTNKNAIEQTFYEAGPEEDWGMDAK